MKKLPIILASLALAVGAGVSLASNNLNISNAESSKTYTHGFTAKPTTTATSLSGVKWKVTSSSNLGAYNSGNYAGVQFGTSKNTGSISMATEYAWGEETGSDYEGYTQIDSISLWLNKGGGDVTPSVTIGGVAATSDGTTVVKNSSAGSDYTKATKVTFTPSASGNTGIVSFKIDSTAAGYLCAISVTCTNPSGTGGVTDSVTFSKNSATIQIGNTYELNAVASGDVTWATSNSSVATVSASGEKNANAVITGVSAGTAKITATVGTASAEFTINVAASLVHTGTLADPFDVADIRNAIDNGLLVSGKRYYIKGLFSKYANNGEYSAQYKNSSFFVKDDLSNEEDFEFYHVASSVPVTFEAGDEVIASATTSNLKIYNGTYEFGSGDLYNPIESITATTKTAITVLGTTLKASDLDVTVNYKHATATVTDGTGVTVNGSSSTVLDSANNNVEVKYTNSAMGTYEGDKEATYTLAINGLVAKTVSSIELQGSLAKTAYTTAEEWDLSGLSLKITYSTSETATIALDNAGVTVTTNPSVPSVGTTSLKVTVTYEGKTTEQDYAVTVSKARKAVYAEYATYNFVGVETELGNNNALNSTNALELFKSATNNENDQLVSATPSGSAYYGNGTSGAFENQGDMLKLGKSGGSGSITLTYPSDIKIGKVVLSAHDWNKDKAAETSLDVEGSKEGAQVGSTTGTYADLTFTLGEATNVITFGTTSKRSFVNKVVVYQELTYTANATSVFDFIDNYMHMDDVSTDDVSNTGACAGSTGYYALASVAYNALNAAAKELFCTNEAFALEHARLVAWATANGQTIDANNNLVAASRISSSIESSSTQMIVVIISITCISLLGAALIMKKRKHQ